MTEHQPRSRRTFLFWTAGAAIFAGLRPWSLFRKPPQKQSRSVMLTQDGKLVEVDPRHTGNVTGRVTDKELQEWIRK
ncbi:MAG TPA: hypothetical protein VF145_04590 [Chitinophagaceae bacterium]